MAITLTYLDPVVTGPSDPAPLTTLDTTGGDGAPLAILALSEPNAVPASMPVGVTGNSGETVEIDVGDEEDVTSVVIGGVTYTRSDSGQPGTYQYSPNTGTVRLTVALQQSIGPSDPIRYTGVVASPPYRTDLLLDYIPSLLSQWNAHGSVTINRSFESQPTASLEFTTTRASETSIRLVFFSGNRFNLWGILFSCDSDVNITRLRNRTDPGSVIRVSVSLRGAWEPKSNEPDVRLLDDGRYTINYSGGEIGTDSASSQTSTTLDKLLRKLDIPYVGQKFTIQIPAKTSASTGVNPISELTNRARTAKGFAFWSNPQGAEIRRWDSTPLHSLSVGDVLSEVQVSYGLSPYYRNTELQLDTDETTGDEVRANEQYTIVTGDVNPTQPPRDRSNNVVELRSPTMAFDNGGPVKERITTTYLNGSVLREKRETYGFIFTSLDVYRNNYSVSYLPDGTAEINTFTKVVDGEIVEVPYWTEWRYRGRANLAFDERSYWQKTGETITENTYDKEGYLIKTETTGWAYSRFKKEGEDKELLTLIRDYIEAYDNGTGSTGSERKERREPGLGILNDIRLYCWRQGSAVNFVDVGALYSLTYDTSFANPQIRSSELTRLPQDDIATYKLADMTRFYPDLTVQEGDPVPRFAWEIERIKNQILTIPNPASTLEETQPPLTTGEAYTEYQRTGVIFPFEGMSEAEWSPRKNEERFVIESLRNNVEGDDTLAITTRVINAGRPSVHERLELYSGDPGEPPSADTSQPEVRLLLNSAEINLATMTQKAINEDLNLPEAGSVQYTGAGDRETALEAAKVDLSIRVTEAVESLGLTVAPTRRYQEGDRVILEGIEYRVWGVTEERRIQNGQLRTDGWQLDLKRYFAPQVVLSEVSEVASEDS